MCELSENQQNKSRQEWDSQSQMKLMVLDGAAHVADNSEPDER